MPKARIRPTSKIIGRKTRKPASKITRGRKARLQKLSDEIRSRANYSLAVLGMSFFHHGSGKFLNIRPVGDRLSFGKHRPRKPNKVIRGGSDKRKTIATVIAEDFLSLQGSLHKTA